LLAGVLLLLCGVRQAVALLRGLHVTRQA